MRGIKKFIWSPFPNTPKNKKLLGDFSLKEPSLADKNE